MSKFKVMHHQKRNVLENDEVTFAFLCSSSPCTTKSSDNFLNDGLHLQPYRFPTLVTLTRVTSCTKAGSRNNFWTEICRTSWTRTDSDRLFSETGTIHFNVVVFQWNRNF